jgi:hypothetical protein
MYIKTMLEQLWHTLTDRLSPGAGGDDLPIGIEPLGQIVMLTVVHDNCEPGSAMLEAVSKGWPRTLSSLKSLLET